MSFAPKHDFRQFESATAMSRLEVEREATPIQKAKRYVELITVFRNAEKPEMHPVDRGKRWMTDKVSVRLRQITAYSAWKNEG